MAVAATVPLFAAQTLTLSGNAVANETVVVGGVTYTWKASVATTANEVKIGADAATSAQNLYDAINATASASGVTFGSLTTANPRVKASAVTATTVVVSALTPGEVGNLIASTETMTNGAWGAATLAAGAGNVNDYITSVIALNQINAEVLAELKKLTIAAD